MSEYARRVELSVTIAGHDVAGVFAPYLLDFTYRDNIGGKSDEVQLSLHNRDGRFSGEWALQKGLPVVASINCLDWEGPGQNLSLPCGLFKIDEIEFSGPPDKISIKAVSADLTGPLRDTRKTRAWENSSLSGVAGQIAQENGLALFYSGPAHPFERQDQRNESDISFLNKLAGERGCHCKVHNGKLAVFDAESAEAAGPSLTIPKKEDMYSPNSYSFKVSSSQTAYTGAQATYTDPKTGTTHIADVKRNKKSKGGNSKNLTLQSRAESPGQAITLGRAKLHEENQKEETVTIEIMGCPKIAAGQTLELTGFGSFSGTYSVKTATHKVGGSGGYTTSLELTAPAPTSGVSAYDTVLGDGVGSGGGSSCAGASGGSQGSAPGQDSLAPDKNKAVNEQARADFEEFLRSVPELSPRLEKVLEMLPELEADDIPAIYDLLLSLPEIASKEADKRKRKAEQATDRAQQEKLEADRTGWEHLANFFYRWFSGPANADAASNKVPYYLDLDWVLKYDRAREAYDRLKQNILNDAAKKELATRLIEHGKLTDKVEYFDFTNKEPAEWRKYEHQYSSVKESEWPSVDGLTAALGGFVFYGFAKGRVEPLPGGGHRIYVTGISTALRDAFNFDEDQSLGFWNEEDKEFTLQPWKGYLLDNYIFRAFRDEYNRGNDFLVITEPEYIEYPEEISYDTAL